MLTTTNFFRFKRNRCLLYSGFKVFGFNALSYFKFDVLDLTKTYEFKKEVLVDSEIDELV